jgi:Ca2+-binding RTX toxin-like protein
MNEIISAQLTNTDLFDGSSFYDDYALNVPSGETITIDLTSDQIDPIVLVYELNSGFPVAENDDLGDGSFNSRVQFTPRQGIDYAVRARSFGEQNQGSYTLEVNSSSGDISIVPLAAGTASINNEPTLQATISGQLTNTDRSVADSFYDDYLLTAESDSPITIDLTGTFDAYIYVYNENGEVLAFDDDGGEGFNSRVEFTPDADETYVVRASSYGSAEGNYNLQASSFAELTLEPLPLSDSASNGSQNGSGDSVEVNVTNVANANILQIGQGASIAGNVIQVLNLGDNPSFLNDADRLKVFQSLILANSSFEFKDYTNQSDNQRLGIGITESFPGGVRTFDGNDTIAGSVATDVVNGNKGSDILTGNEGNDYLRGGQDSDDIDGGDNDDILNGNKGQDTVDGSAGNDYVRGGPENDLLIGGEGDDILVGDKDSDTLLGQGGADTFIFRSDLAAGQFDPSAADRVMDFDSADKIGISGGLPLDQIRLDDLGNATAVVIASTNEILGVVLNQSPSGIQSALISIQANDFVLTRVG